MKPWNITQSAMGEMGMIPYMNKRKKLSTDWQSVWEKEEQTPHIES